MTAPDATRPDAARADTARRVRDARPPRGPRPPRHPARIRFRRSREVDAAHAVADDGETLDLRPGLDLRMVPAALVAWASVAALLVVRDAAPGAAMAATGAAAAALLLRGGWPQAAMPALAGAVATAAAAVRIAAADRHPLAARAGSAETVTLRLAGAPRRTEHGAVAQAAVDGLPGRVTVFGGEGLLGHDAGTRLRAVAGVDAADRPSLSGLTLALRGDPVAVAPPSGHVARVRAGLAEAAAALPPGPGRLVPAMTLGDERAFTPEYRDMMTDAGLAHLTAVSGANVALVVGAAMAALAWAPPRARVAAGAVALAGFVAVAGTEPSVLRAMLAGAVGLVAVVTGRAHQAVPALAGGCVVLLVAYPDLAVSVGFALSVAATAGLVLAAAPVTRRLLRVPVLRAAPAPVVRAVAVALVAHVATAPVLALTVGEVSHVAVAANIAAAPAVAPVTVAGTLAAVAVLLHLQSAAVVLVHVAAPFAWWVHCVGEIAASVPGASSAMGPAGAAAVVAAAVAAWRFPAPAAALAALLCGATATALAAGVHQPAAPPGWRALACVVDGRVVGVEPGREPPGGGEGARACRRAAARGGAAAGEPAGDPAVTRVAEDIGDLEKRPPAGAAGPAPGGPSAVGEPRPGAWSRADWAAVVDCGERARRRVRLPDGTPVVCPARDGPAALYPGGAVWTQGVARWDA